jgi:hypothetical protein
MDCVCSYNISLLSWCIHLLNEDITGLVQVVTCSDFSRTIFGTELHTTRTILNIIQLYMTTYGTNHVLLAWKLYLIFEWGRYDWGRHTAVTN